MCHSSYCWEEHLLGKRGESGSPSLARPILLLPWWERRRDGGDTTYLLPGYWRGGKKEREDSSCTAHLSIRSGGVPGWNEGRERASNGSANACMLIGDGRDGGGEATACIGVP